MSKLRSHLACLVDANTGTSSPPLSVTDCRGIVKTLVCGMKTITWGAGSCKVPGATAADIHTQGQKVFLPHETLQFVRLFRHGLVALDIYRVNNLPNGGHTLRSANCQTVKTKEEKEVLEHFAGVFTMMSMTMFKEVFTELVEYLVERIQNNYALQILPNALLANSSTSATFASILLGFLLKRMDDMGRDMEKSNLYLKLFKLVFGSVTLFAQENELMLKPHLHEIVNRSMSLANTASEPCNYFLLLRALFRSIGGGSHEQLYQEFLPLLSDLLQGLNRLQSGQHKPYMKDLFVELCLTVPVRLSSLLPYLHMLMDPLVSALNGSQTLISQGLRTLELCVDNLQPDFLYDHIQPVRAELMQALWSTLHNSDDNVATVAYRVLGKFGGSNRKMLSTPQPLQYKDTLQEGAALRVTFPHTEDGHVDLQVGVVIEAALKVLQPTQTSSTVDSFYRQQAWGVIQSFLVAMLNLSDVDSDLYNLLKGVTYQPTELHSGRLKHICLPQCSNKQARDSFESALYGIFISSCLRDLRTDALVFMAGIVKHITTVAVLQQCSSTNLLKQPAEDVMDVYVLLDSITKCMCSEEKELNKIGELALKIVIETATTILGDKEKASELPLFEVAVDKMCGCCYERAWFAKNGGCSAILFLMEKMPLKWVISHQLTFVMALLYVLLDLTNEVSSGTMDRTKEYMDKLLSLCNSQLPTEEAELTSVQEKATFAVCRHLVKEVISPNEHVRKQAHHSLRQLADISHKSVTELMEPHKEILADMIPPKKHLLKHQPVSTQIALMDGNTFCTTLSPRLFSLKLSINEHQVFFQELIFLCDSDDATLAKLPCYRSVPSLTPLKVSGLAALAACHYLPDVREKVFTVLYKAINSTVKELQEAGKDAMKKFMAEHSQADIELVHSALRPLLMMLGDYRNLNPTLLLRLTHMIELFPTSFNEKMCNSLMAHLRSWMEVVSSTSQIPARKGDEVQICLHIMNMFHLLPASTFRLFEPLLILALKGEKALGIELGSPFRQPVLKFALKFPSNTVDFFLCRLFDSALSRLFLYFVCRKEGAPLVESLATSPQKIISTTFTLASQLLGDDSAVKRRELQFQGVSLCHMLVEGNEEWIKDQPLMVDFLRKMWVAEAYHSKLATDNIKLKYWEECSMLVTCLLTHCKHHHDDVTTLFQLLRVFTTRHVKSFHFLTSYLENDVAKLYPIAEKRVVFFKFVELFTDTEFPQELKGKILQYILIPMFTATFEEGKGDELLGGAPDPEHDNDENIISVFINKVINPDKPFGSSDSVCILLLQLSSLLVEHAAPHIHDSNNKRQGAKLRRLMTFAWPCLLPKQCVDPATKYHGHLLLAHIIAKFAIHKRIVLQVFHSLLKAHALEARSIVRQALDILTPVVPIRMEDANATLVHWTKKIIVEEGHSVAQLIHMLQLLCRHYRVYYPVRQHLVQHMVSSIQRLGLTPNATIEQRKLAVDLAEVIIKWEFQRVRESQEADPEPMDTDGAPPAATPTATPTTSGLGLKRTASDGTGDSKKARTQTTVADPQWSLEKQHADAIINFLIRLACQVNDSQSLPVGGVTTPGEALSKRCVTLVKTSLKPDIWPNIDIKIPWFAKLFDALTQTDPSTGNSVANYANICTALDLLTFLLQVLPQNVILAGFKTLHKGLNVCMTCGNTKVVRYVHALLTRLLGMFPPEHASSAVASKYDELDILYASVAKVISDGLSLSEKASTLGLSQLQCTLMVLKAPCNNDPCYIDRFLTLFLKVTQRLHKEHITLVTPSGDSQTVSELLQWSLDMIKTRLSVMPQDTRKAFLNILTSLIEKSPDPKLLKVVTKMVEEWVKAKHEHPGHSSPSLREKSLLLTRMMVFYEKRFPDDQELLAQFLEIILFVYKNESASSSELLAKLEPAFLCGLRCPQVPMRSKFQEVYEGSVSQRVFDRMLYVLCSQNWEHCGSYFWVKHCIDLVLTAGSHEDLINHSPSSPRLPCISSISHITTTVTTDVTEPPAISTQLPEELLVMEGNDSSGGEDGRGGALKKLASKLNSFLTDARTIKTGQYLISLAHLCHLDTELAHHVWIDLFPRVWTALSDAQREVVSREVSPFMCSGAHLVQMDSHPSAVGSFLEAVVKCKPQPQIRSCILKYLGKTHNYWHGSALLLEERVLSEQEVAGKVRQIPSYDGNYGDQILDPLQQESLDSLSELYSSLSEDDMWAGLWTERAQFPDTALAIVYESQGLFEQAQETYEQVIKQARELHNSAPAPPSILPEYKVWEEHWCRCSKELGHWETLNDFGKSQNGINPFLVLENAWRVQDWTAMKEASTQAEPICSENYSARLNLLRGFLALCYPDEQRLSAVEKLIEAASIQGIKQWRRLPKIVSHAHVSLLQLSQQIMELQEATTIHSGLQSGGLTRQSFQTEIKTIFKTWKNRLPNCSDDLSHWSDIFSWRQLHYKHLVKAYEGSTQSNQAMLIVHHSASAIIQYARIARKHQLFPVCLDSLSKIHSIPSVPVLDCFQKIRQQVKCYLGMSSLMEDSELDEAMDVIESTNLKYFTKEMISEFMALKGTFLAQIGRAEEANKSFSAAVQLHDNLVKAWALWGDFLDILFDQDHNLTLGASALTCFLHACRNQSEGRCRKYIARIFWILSFDDDKGTLAEIVDKYYGGISPMHWLPWIPQLLTCLVRKEGGHMLNLLCSLGKAYPQALYFPIRALYLSLKMEQRGKHKADQASKVSTPMTSSESSLLQGEPMDTGEKPPENQHSVLVAKLAGTPTSQQGLKDSLSASANSTQSSSSSTGETAQIRAPASLWRCSRIMYLLRDLHPTLLSALEGIVDQLVWFRENWYEELLRQLNEGLIVCQAAAFENRTDVVNAKISPEMIQFVAKLVNTFGIGLEQSGLAGSSAGGAISHEALAKRAQAAAQDPAFQRLKAQFANDFDFSSPNSQKLHMLIAKLKRWIKILELKTKSLQKSFLLEDRCRFLSNFSLATADVEIPGEYLFPKPMPYFVRIARFMPRVEIVQRHNSTVRRLYIQGHNGKIYPYLVLNDPQGSRCRSEERILQLLSMVNLFLEKDKETCRRNLVFTIPRVVAVSPQMRLIEDNKSSISLADIFKQYCSAHNLDWDCAMVKYYEALSHAQSLNEPLTPQLLYKIFNQIQATLIPPTILREWAEQTYLTTTDYWTFRKQVTNQLSLCGLVEFVFHLSRVDPDILHITSNTGQLTQSFFTFQINQKGCLDAHRPVPFRLTPGLQTLITKLGLTGPLQMSMLSAARCLVQPSVSLESILRAVLRDEFISWRKREQESRSSAPVSSAEIEDSDVVKLVMNGVTAIMTRLHNVAELEGGESKVTTLIGAAASIDNVCRMDPSWNPWI
ncbi:transformation/transcription domain-associated protein-like isoform X2 [Halichondria panicea]|uniref:transformation/transcription domain-associated protein-like isoform X2 n=1 Tax=Halichondria panicea TaxID=6063 RepID=UPI00312B64B1